MALDDYVESEVAIAVAVTAAALSPRVRGILRTGAVYGLAGVFAAGDAIGAFARGVGRGAQQAAAATAGAAATATGTATSDATPATPEEAADQLSATAHGETESAPGPSRRGARARTEQTDGKTNE